MTGSVAWILIGVALGAYNTWNMTRMWNTVRAGDRSLPVLLLLTLSVITGPVLLVYIFLTDII